SIFGPHSCGDGAMHSSGAWLFAAIDLSSIGNGLLTLLAIAGFAVVWLVSHAIHILILLSPWGVVDAALKSARISLMALVAGLSFLNPYVGAALSLIIIIIACCLAG